MKEEDETGETGALIRERELLSKDIEKLEAKRDSFEKKHGLSYDEKEFHKGARRILSKEIQRLKKLITDINERLKNIKDTMGKS